MTTPETVDEHQDQDQAVSPGQFIQLMADAAAANPDQPTPLAAGTFVAYPMPDGGLMFVTNVMEGPFAGQQHHRIPPGMIRAAATLFGGGSKVDAIKGLIGRRKRLGQ
jgi:hypothetical protein